jgi:hypothetical protein
LSVSLGKRFPEGFNDRAARPVEAELQRTLLPKVKAPRASRGEQSGRVASLVLAAGASGAEVTAAQANLEAAEAARLARSCDSIGPSPMTESSAGGTGDPAAQRGAGINPMQAIAARLTAAERAYRAADFASLPPVPK